MTPNRLLDETARAGAALPARHRSIVDLLKRELLGWHREGVAISLKAIGARLRVSASTVREAVEDLERWRIVRRRGAGRGRVAVFELLDPDGWRIAKTAGAIRAAERRRRARGGDQPLLPFPDVARVFEIPTQIGDRTRDRTRDIPPSRFGAHFSSSKRKKKAAGNRSNPRGRIPGTLSRPGKSPMPNDETPRPTEDPREREALRQLLRRRRAARFLLAETGVAFELFDERLDLFGAKLSEEEIITALAGIERRDRERATSERLRRQAENMRHEHR